MKIFTLSTALLFCCVLWAQNPLTMLPNTWCSIPNTKMSAVTPTNGQFPGTWSTCGPSALITGWSGAALDSKRSRLIIFGGGHDDYAGNELYAFDVNTMSWERLTDPFVNPAKDNSDLNPDSTPQSRHTYGGLAYLAHADRFFALGGAIYQSGYAACRKVWTFDLAAKKWTRDSANPPFVAEYDCTCAYDPLTKMLWFCENDGGGWAHVRGYNFDTKVWSSLRIGDDPHYGAVALDTKRGLLVVLPTKAGVGAVKAYDVRGNSPAQTWQTTGGDEFLGKCWESGFEYDSVADKLVGWSADKVFVLDPDTKVWTVNNPPGAPAPSGRGTYGRWRYVPSVNAFILVTGISTDVHFYKLDNLEVKSERAATCASIPAVSINASPEPFNPASRISLSLPAASAVRLEVADMTGKVVRVIFNGDKAAGNHEFGWNATDQSGKQVTSGAYLYRLTAGQSRLALKTIYMR